MKKLICLEDIEALVKSGQKIVEVDKNTLITPSAKDAIAKYGLTCQEICSEKVRAGECSASQSEGINEEAIYNILKVLAGKGLLNNEMIAKLGIDASYLAEREEKSGLKVVRGHTVHFEKLDTGKDDVKANYQEVVHSSDSKMNAGFLTIDQSSFDWHLTCDEIYYVIDGDLSISVNDKTILASSGDVVFLPNNSKVTLSAKNKVQLFYTSQPLTRAW